MSNLQTESWIALVSSAIAIIAWTYITWRTIIAVGSKREKGESLVMPLTALLASLGTSASALGLAIYAGTLSITIDTEVLTLVASMGRGALAAAGLIVISRHVNGA